MVVLIQYVRLVVPDGSPSVGGTDSTDEFDEDNVADVPSGPTGKASVRVPEVVTALAIGLGAVWILKILATVITTVAVLLTKVPFLTR